MCGFQHFQWNGNPWFLEVTLVFTIVSIPVNIGTALITKSWL